MGRLRPLAALCLLAAMLAWGCGEGGDDEAAIVEVVHNPEEASAEERQPSGPTTEVPTAAPTPEPTPTPAADEAGPRPRVVVLDPGHGGPDDVGAARNGLVEKHSNLDMALRVEALLAEKGYKVVLTRRTDSRSVGYTGRGLTGFSASRLDLQARVDLANDSRADLFVSLHSNGSSNAGERGVEVWYDPGREFGKQNQGLARLLLGEVLRELRYYGFEVTNRGLKDDTCFRVFNDRCFPLFLLGPPRETTRAEVLRRGGDPVALGMAPGVDVFYSRATGMPGALIELLFVSNDADNAILQTESARQAMARGVAAAVENYFAEQ